MVCLKYETIDRIQTPTEVKIILIEDWLEMEFLNEQFDEFECDRWSCSQLRFVILANCQVDSRLHGNDWRTMLFRNNSDGLQAIDFFLSLQTIRPTAFVTHSCQPKSGLMTTVRLGQRLAELTLPMAHHS